MMRALKPIPITQLDFLQQFAVDPAELIPMWMIVDYDKRKKVYYARHVVNDRVILRLALRCPVFVEP